MYKYIIEKTLPRNYKVEDVVALNDLLTNNENVHRLLGRLFGVSKEKDWRSKYNVLYKHVDGSIAKWIVQSDIAIDTETAKQENVVATTYDMPKIDNIIELQTTVAPFARQDANKKNRIMIKTPEERKAWVSMKISYGEICQVLSCDEKHQVMSYMAHKDRNKGATTLLGYEYHLKVKVNDAKAFEEMMNKGIGPCKSYGFGLVNVV